MAKYKLVNTLEFGDVFAQVLVWMILTVITLGIALPFFGYFVIKLIINHTEIHQIGE